MRYQMDTAILGFMGVRSGVLVERETIRGAVCMTGTATERVQFSKSLARLVVRARLIRVKIGLAKWSYAYALADAVGRAKEREWKAGAAAMIRSRIRAWEQELRQWE